MEPRPLHMLSRCFVSEPHPAPNPFLQRARKGELDPHPTSPRESTPSPALWDGAYKAPVDKERSETVSPGPQPSGSDGHLEISAEGLSKSPGQQPPAKEHSTAYRDHV